MFVDRVEIEVIAGDGGDGCMSFRREKFVPKGGPDGGDGGDGGSVVLVAEAGVNSLVAVSSKKIWKAERGWHGSGAKRHGRRGVDQVIKVPPGTVVRDVTEGFLMKDLAAEADSVVVARGGRGGRGNTQFKSSINRAPRRFTRGEDGERRRIILELKVIADVGIIGKPNAGKSTLLSRLSRARPEIAAYPFTTKYPNLGLVQIDFDRSFVMADIPGLIEGAHDGAGLGHEFLRHIERAGVLVHLVEPLPMDQTDPIENYHTIRSELTEYKEELGHRPEIVCVTKAELPGADEVRQRLAEDLGREVTLFSAVTGLGLNQLVAAITRELGNATSVAARE